MHNSAFSCCRAFFAKYLASQSDLGNLKVIDFGAYDVNGTLKPIFKDCNYIGIDMSAGPNVDIVCNGQATPFESNSVDVVTSSSNFEHDDCFWVTFLEMCRIVKPGGLIYINAPSGGPYHGFPGDCWRFYKDSWAALAKWADKNGHHVSLVESYIDNTCEWKDSVGIFKKGAN
jgi:hypothetical protein